MLAYMLLNLWGGSQCKLKAESYLLQKQLVISSTMTLGNVGKHELDQWLKRISNSIANSRAEAIINNEHTGKISFLDQITQQCPTYLHELYQSAC